MPKRRSGSPSSAPVTAMRSLPSAACFAARGRPSFIGTTSHGKQPPFGTLRGGGWTGGSESGTLYRMGELVNLSQRSTRPLYTVSDAARYAHVARANLKNWVSGYQVDGKSYPALLLLPEEQPFGQTALSFENLIEAALIGHWRRRGIPLQRIRRAHTLALGELGEHPFARQKVYVGGTDLFIEADRVTESEGGNSFTVLTRQGQRVLGPIAADYLQYIDWQTGEGYAYQYRPPEGCNVVKLNPKIEFGLPNVHRIRTETIMHRFSAYESVKEIAEDFGLDADEVEQGLRYEWALTTIA